MAGKKNADPTVAGITITHPDRVLDEAQGLTKLRLAQYYEAVADWMLPHLAGRPLSLLRCHGGALGGGGCFYQKHVKEGMAPSIHGLAVMEKAGPADYIGIDDLAGLIALVQMGTMEFHPWGSRIDNIEHPDRLIFDLDPDVGLGFPTVIAAAKGLRRRLEGDGLTSFVKTTGGKGLHVVVPLAGTDGWDPVKEYARRVAEAMVRDAPDGFVATMTKAKRKGKIFIDFFRNDRGATAVAAYSTRARKGCPIATPLGWDELDDGLTGDSFHADNILARLKTLKRDPWAELCTLKQKLPQSAASSSRP